MKIIVIGSGGRLGAALLREYWKKFEVTGLNHAQLDLANEAELRQKLLPLDFNVLINAAAFTNVDLCETRRETAFRINAEGPQVLAEICRDKKAKLIHFSTDYVFDGEKREPYTEEDPARAISVYGESKLAGEQNVLDVQDWNLVVRVSWVFGPDRPSFIDAVIKRAREEEHVEAVADKFSTPTYTLDIARMLPPFFDRDIKGGILHFANAGECSWQQYAQWALDSCRDADVPLRTNTIGAIKLRDMGNWVARRPVYSALSTDKYTNLSGNAPRAWRDAVADYIKSFYPAK